MVWNPADSMVTAGGTGARNDGGALPVGHPGGNGNRGVDGIGSAGVVLTFFHLRFKTFDGCDRGGVNAVAHRQVISSVIAQMQAGPYMRKGKFTLGIDEVGIETFQHEGLFG